MPGNIALGFRVKSGFALAVALSGTTAAPVPVARRIVQLSDPGVEETRQPYHDGFGTAQQDVDAIARLTNIIQRVAKRSVAELLADGSLEGKRCESAALIVGSVIDPATVGNPHIRAHANEGRLFRTVLEDALGSRGVRSVVIVEKTLGPRAIKALGRPSGQIRKTIAGFGEALGGPWRADEKAAATAAWMILGLQLSAAHVG